MDATTQDDASAQSPTNQLALAMAAVDDTDEGCTCPWKNVLYRLACRCCVRSTCVAIVLHFVIKWQSNDWPWLMVALPLIKVFASFALLIAVFLFPYADFLPVISGLGLLFDDFKLRERLRLGCRFKEYVEWRRYVEHDIEVSIDEDSFE